MDTFDIIVTVMGAVMTLIGLYLFVSGKKEGASANHVEGFGVKVNVSNPSILLIVLGVGLLLAPRLLPQNGIVEDVTGLTKDQPITGLFEDDGGTSPPQGVVKDNPPTQPVETYQSPPTGFMPTGLWTLSGYQENGIDFSGNASGQIQFSTATANQMDWHADLMFLDAWGNVNNYQYRGRIAFSGSSHNITFTASNAPNFYPQGPVPLDFKMDPGNILHMGYLFNGSNILLHFQQ